MGDEGENAVAHYFKIGELARLYHINADTLRYYEEQGIIEPKRMPNGYRVYSPQDVWRLNVIRDLRALGIPLSKIRDYLQTHSANSTLHLLEAEEVLIAEQIDCLRAMEKNVRERKEKLRAALDTPVGEIHLRTFPPRACYHINQSYRTDEEMDVLIQRLLALNQESLYVLGNDEMGSLINLNAAYEGSYREYDGVFMVHRDGNHELPGGQYLCVSYRGDCRQNARFIPMLLHHAAQNGLYPDGTLLEMVRTDIHISGDPQEHLTELQLRVVPDIAHQFREPSLD